MKLADFATCLKTVKIMGAMDYIAIVGSVLSVAALIYSFFIFFRTQRIIREAGLAGFSRDISPNNGILNLIAHKEPSVRALLHPRPDTVHIIVRYVATPEKKPEATFSARRGAIRSSVSVPLTGRQDLAPLFRILAVSSDNPKGGKGSWQKDLRSRLAAKKKQLRLRQRPGNRDAGPPRPAGI